MVTRWSLMLGMGAALTLSAAAHVRAVDRQQPALQGSGVVTGPVSYPQQRALLNRYCVTCHNERSKSAGLSLDALDLANVGQHAEAWEKVVKKLRAGVMPPAGRPRPDRAGYDGFVSWLETELDRAVVAGPNAGRTETFHRLNRAEYANAIRDLLALDMNVSALLPSDDASYGFDNIAGVLKINQSTLERYLSAARTISRAAVGSPPPGPSTEEFRVADDARQYEHIEGLPLGTRGGMLVRHNFPQDAEYLIKVVLLCRISGECDGALGFADSHQLEITLDGERLQLFDLQPQLDSEQGASQQLQVRVAVKAGPRRIGATFLRLPTVDEVESLRLRFQRPYYINGNSVIQQQQAVYQPFVDSVTIAGPFGATGPGDTPSRRRIFICRPSSDIREEDCARRILTTLARRAYRRPATEIDLAGLLASYKEGRTQGGFEAGIEMALRRLLVSPHFLFRVERDPKKAAPGTNYRVGDLELASRLSFFLWSSIPDDQLLDAAVNGTLRNRDVLAREVRRMLGDAKSKALVDNFVGQWLQLRNLDLKKPDIPLFPDFDGSLRQAFRRETELFVSSVMRGDRSVVELLTANYTFVNERLARHYGIPNVSDSHFRRVRLGEDSPRRGLLGHGSILTVTSRPNRTSPVIRGKWVLENIIGITPPPPPPDVPSLPENDPERLAAPRSVRDRLAEHRSNPVCASCHAMIDPAGFALESFDAIGRWRDLDEAFRPIDASGVFPDGTKFGNFAEFRVALLSDSERFVNTLAEKLLTYALGRGLEYYDMPAVRRIVRDAARDDHRFSAVLTSIVESIPFQMRRTEERASSAQIAAHPSGPVAGRK